MDNRDKFISVNTVLVGTRTFKECYKENEKVFSPELVEFAYNVLNMVEEFVNRIPPVDAVKVVRCKDCRFLIDREDGTHGCYRHFVDQCELDDFCSYGERK
jgi:hypothetical protein